MASGHAAVAGTHAGSITPGTTMGSARSTHAGTVSVRFGNSTVTE
jgi:hypothetical protein